MKQNREYGVGHTVRVSMGVCAYVYKYACVPMSMYVCTYACLYVSLFVFVWCGVWPVMHFSYGL